MRAFARLAAVTAALTGLGVTAADTVTVSDSVQFVSDLEAPATLSIPQFDDLGGTLTLQAVDVEFCHSGGVDMAADNDDPFNTASVRGRMIRVWNATGPGAPFVSGNETITTAFIGLTGDDGDGGNNDVFDATPGDGHDYGTVSYGPLSTGVAAAPLAPFLGGGTVDYTVTPTLLINDLQFDGDAPDSWQLEVENPTLDIEVKVTYTFVPEPSTLALLALGGLLLRRR